MKVNILGKISVELDSTDVKYAISLREEKMGRREALIEFARQEAQMYAHDRGYLEFNGIKESSSGYWVEFKVKGMEKIYKNSIGIPVDFDIRKKITAKRARAMGLINRI